MVTNISNFMKHLRHTIFLSDVKWHFYIRISDKNVFVIITTGVSVIENIL